MTQMFASRVAERAQQINLVRLLLSVLAAPFWLAGAVAGLVWLAASWCIAAVVIGFADAGRSRRVTD